jgi:hypothetical protein
VTPAESVARAEAPPVSPILPNICVSAPHFPQARHRSAWAADLGIGPGHGSKASELAAVAGAFIDLLPVLLGQA